MNVAGPYNLLIGGMLALMSKEITMLWGDHHIHVYLFLCGIGPLIVGYHFMGVLDKVWYSEVDKDGKWKMSYIKNTVSIKYSNGLLKILSRLFEVV